MDRGFFETDSSSQGGGGTDAAGFPFTAGHMELLLTAYDGIRQISQNLLMIAGDIDATSRDSIFWKFDRVEKLISELSPLYGSVSPSGVKMQQLDWGDPENRYAAALDDDGMDCGERARRLMAKAAPEPGGGTSDSVLPSVPFTFGHMELLLASYDGMREFEDKLLSITGSLDAANEGSPIWKLRHLGTLISRISPLYNAASPTGKKMSALDWDDPENLYAAALDRYGSDIKERAELLFR